MLSKRINSISPSLTLEFSAKVKRMTVEEGCDIVNFTVGEPDFGTPDYIKQAAMESIRLDQIKYTAVPGLQDLREAIAYKLKRDNGLDYTAENILVCTGAKQALFNILFALLDPGDEVLIPSPYWLSYPEMVKLADGKSVFVHTSQESNFKVTVEDLESSFHPNVKCLILNNPNNPTGAVYSDAELKKIAKWAENKKIYVISDEIYEKLTYDENFSSFGRYRRNLGNYCVLVNGFSKAYAMTGWRLGYVAAEKELITKISSMQGHTTSNANTISQYAAIAAIRNEGTEVEHMVAAFKERRDYLESRLKKMGLYFVKPQGAFYGFVNIKKYKKGSSIDFANQLLEEAKIAVIPGAVFGNDDYVRISYATKLDSLQKGMDRLEVFLDKKI